MEIGFIKIYRIQPDMSPVHFVKYIVYKDCGVLRDGMEENPMLFAIASL